MSADSDELRWALQNSFTLLELRSFFLEHPEAVFLSADILGTAAGEFGRRLLAQGDVAEELEREVNQTMQQRIIEFQAERKHWREIIAELRRLRACGKLVAEGTPV